MTKEQVPLAAQKRLSADERYVEKGRRMVRNYNCQACHRIGEEGGTYQAIVEDQLESSGGDTLQAAALTAPILYNEKSKIGEGSRVHTDWLHGFLDKPREPDPALAPAAHAVVPVRRGAAQHHHPLLRGPGRGAPTPTSRSHPSTRRWWPRAATSSAAGSA